jgi:hypothetical protein
MKIRHFKVGHFTSNRRWSKWRVRACVCVSVVNHLISARFCSHTRQAFLIILLCTATRMETFDHWAVHRDAFSTSLSTTTFHVMQYFRYWASGRRDKMMSRRGRGPFHPDKPHLCRVVMCSQKYTPKQKVGSSHKGSKGTTSKSRCWFHWMA